MKESFSTVNRVGTDGQALLGGAVSGILVPVFLGRVEEDVCTAVQLREILIANNEDPDCLPSLYVDFDKKVLYSMYAEPASYEDFAPSGWRAECTDFYGLIPEDEQYWIKEKAEE